MNKNEVGEFAPDDSLICKVGEEDISALVSGNHRAADISSTMRYLAKFLTLVRCHFPATKSLEDVFNFTFDEIVHIVKIQAVYDPETVQFAKPTVAKTLGLGIAEAAKI